jgi:hypothetical protein
MEIFDIILSYGNLFIAELLAAAGRSPFAAMGYIMTHGGLIIFFPMMVWMLWWIWVFYVVGEYMMKQKYVLLAIDVPAINEQSMRAVEQMLVALHGVLFSYNKKDLYWHGMQIEPFSLEIVSIDGYIQYFIWTNERYVNVVKAAVYAQYPDAEIVEVEDYTNNVPSKFPDEEYDLWGTELVLEKDSVYPIKTYEYFEHSLTGTFADPMASILEQLSRLRPGEQAWLQFVITPTSGGIRASGLKEVESLIGKDSGYSPGAAEKLIFGTMDTLYNALSPAHFDKELTSVPGREAEDGNFMGMTTGDRLVVEEIQKKISRLQFDTKFRFVYIAKKEVFDRFRVAGGVFGALKQFSSLDLNSFTNGTWTTTSRPTYFFWKWRRNVRETKMIQSFRSRSNWNGENPITLSTTELATIFHFPLESAQAPLLSTTESKKAEPPSRLPQQLPMATPEPIPEDLVESQGEPEYEAPRGQRIPREGEELRPASGIPAALVQRMEVETEKPLAQSMKGLPPGVYPIEGRDWQTLDEWSLKGRSALEHREQIVHEAATPQYFPEKGPMQSAMEQHQIVAQTEEPSEGAEPPQYVEIHHTEQPKKEKEYHDIESRPEVVSMPRSGQHSAAAAVPPRERPVSRPTQPTEQLRTQHAGHVQSTPPAQRGVSQNPDERRVNRSRQQSKDVQPPSAAPGRGAPPPNLPF